MGQSAVAGHASYSSRASGKSGPYRMHLSCRDAINNDLESKVVKEKRPKSAKDD